MEEKAEAAAAGTLSLLQLGRGLRAVRAHQPEAPETFGAYEKKTEKSTGVVALMDMITKELGDDMKDAEYDEKTAQKDYAELMADSQETRAQNAKSITAKEAAKAELVDKKTVAKQKESRDYE